MKGLGKWQALMLPVVAISMVFVMLVPIPGFVLDVLLAASITASVIVFLTAIQVRKAVDFSVFPTLLLLLTLFRLSLNIASSRRILLHGHEGTHAAGGVIRGVWAVCGGGELCGGVCAVSGAGGDPVLVVAHGAVRTAEVTARFTLDALPGKQMAIDADMNAGLIDQEEGAEAAGEDCAGGGVLRVDGRRGEVQPARRDGDDFDHGDQHHCGHCDWHAAAGGGFADGGEDVHDSDRGRWSGDVDSEPAGFDCGRDDSDAGFKQRAA